MAEERRFRQGQYEEKYGYAPVIQPASATPPTIAAQQPTPTTRRDEARRETRSSYNVQDIQSQQGVGVTPGATPTEQRAGGAASFIQPYDDPTEDFVAGLRVLFGGTEAGQFANRPLARGTAYNQFVNPPTTPYNPMSQTIGMPFNYGDYDEWQTSRTMSGNQQTMTTGGVGSADQEAAFNQFQMWSETGNPQYRPGYITPLTQQIFQLSDEQMLNYGYIQDGAGGWVKINLGDDSLTGDGYYGGGGGGGGGGYKTPSSFRSGYTSGLVNWRIGL